MKKTAYLFILFMLFLLLEEQPNMFSYLLKMSSVYSKCRYNLSIIQPHYVTKMVLAALF